MTAFLTARITKIAAQRANIANKFIAIAERLESTLETFVKARSVESVP